MKFTASDYNYVKTEITKVVNRVGIEKIQLYKESLKTDKTVKNLEIRFMFDLYRAVPYENRKRITEKDYNDNHLQTALKKIVKELNL